MNHLRCGLGVVLALAGQLLLVELRLGGAAPLLLPPVVCLAGQRFGPEWGVECGLLGGGLLWLFGGGPGGLALLPLLGGAAGGVFPRGEGLLQRWVLCLPALAGYELLVVLGHLPVSVPGALALGAKEFVLCAAALPAVEALLAGCTEIRLRCRRRA